MSEYVKLNDNVKFGITIHHPISGYTVNATITPRYLAYINSSDTPVLSGLFTLRSGLVGTYRGNFDVTVANGFTSGDYVEVHASGEVDGVVGRTIIRNFVIDDIYSADLIRISGVAVGTSKYIPDKVWDERQDQHTQNVTFGSGLQGLYQNIYFAAIKFVKDDYNSQDEYVVQWFRNDSPLASGQVTNPAISVYRTSTSTALFQNKRLHYYNVDTGGLRYDETANLAASGEPYLAMTSGIIDGAWRTWSNPIGIGYLSDSNGFLLI